MLSPFSGQYRSCAQQHLRQKFLNLLPNRSIHGYSPFQILTSTFQYLLSRVTHVFSSGSVRSVQVVDYGVGDLVDPVRWTKRAGIDRDEYLREPCFLFWVSSDLMRRQAAREHARNEIEHESQSSALPISDGQWPAGLLNGSGT